MALEMDGHSGHPTHEGEAPETPAPGHSPAEAPSNAPPLAAGMAPDNAQGPHLESAPRLQPRIPGALEALQARAGAPPAGAAPGAWRSEPEARAAPRKRPGRKPDPTSERAPRTFLELLTRAKASGDALLLAEAMAFGQAVLAAMLARAKASGNAEREAEALSFGRAHGLIAPGTPPAPQAPRNAQPGEPPLEAPAEAAAPPPPLLFMGQPAERVAMYAGALLPGVETLADVARALGVDVTTPRKRVLFRGTPVEKEIAADPVARMTELLAVEASERFAPKEGPGDTKAERRTELLILGGATFGPALLRFMPAVATLPSKVLSGVKAALALLRRRK